MHNDDTIVKMSTVSGRAKDNQNKTNEPTLLIDEVHHLLQRELTTIQRKGKAHE